MPDKIVFTAEETSGLLGFPERYLPSLHARQVAERLPPDRQGARSLDFREGAVKIGRMKGKRIQNIPVWLHVPLAFWHWFETAVLTVTCCLIGWVVFPLSLVLDRGNGRLMHAIAVLWSRLLLLINPFWRVKVSGLENIEKGRHYVVIANHQSILDILVMLSGLPLHFKFLSKKEVFQIPFIGWHMKLTGYIPLDRGNHESGRSAIAIARAWLNRKVNVVFFPEGTRSLDGHIRTFKPGAFKLAQEQKIAILPVVIEGTGDALPKKSWILKQRRDFILSIGKPVILGAQESVPQLIERVRQEMIQRLQQIRTGTVPS